LGCVKLNRRLLHRLCAGRLHAPLLLALLGAHAYAPAHATAPAPAPAHEAMVQRLIEQQQPQVADNTRGNLRIEVDVGRLDERLRLAPCTRIEPQWPAGQRAWGRIRVGLRCVEGPVAWKVYLPVTVKVWGRALVATEALPAGTRLAPRHFVTKDVDLAQGPSLPLAPRAAVDDRLLARALPAGAPLREADLRARQWFAAGDVVRVVALGDGYEASGEGTALDPGVEGRRARVRTESGRVVIGDAVAERRIEVRP
jgi:flagellar basal body P-ring formation protein FlgA